MKSVKIAFGYKARSGKDTAADYIESKYTASGILSIRLRFAAGVYKIGDFITDTVGEPRQKRPDLLQYIGLGMRNIFGPDVWVNSLITEVGNVPPNTNICITDMRFKNEMAAMKAAGFVTVNIVRENRPIDRDPNHPSEIDLDGETFDHVITNNGTLEEFYLSLDQLMCTINKGA